MNIEEPRRRARGEGGFRRSGSRPDGLAAAPWSTLEYSPHKLLLHPDKVRAILEVLGGRATHDPTPPITAELQLTDACNLACTWCRTRSSRASKARLDRDVAVRTLAWFAEAGVGVTLEGGGEPTLHPDFADIARRGAALGVHLGLITNGTTDLSDVAGAFRWVRVSLDAATREEFRRHKGRNAFPGVLANLRRLAAARDPVRTQLGVSFVLTAATVATAWRVLPELDAAGVDFAYLRPVEGASELAPSPAALLALRERVAGLSRGWRMRCIVLGAERLAGRNEGLPCVAHSLACTIQADGAVVLCKKRTGEPIVLGDLRVSPFEELWRSRRRVEASRRLTDPACQRACDACRLTPFNRLFADLRRVHTSHFI